MNQLSRQIKSWWTHGSKNVEIVVVIMIDYRGFLKSSKLMDFEKADRGCGRAHTLDI